MSGARQLRRGDVEVVAQNMRASDVRTLAAIFPELTPLEVLNTGVYHAALVWTFVHEREPIAIYGATPLSMLSDSAAPWLLATDMAFKYGRALVRDGRRYTERMLDYFPHLMNYVDSRDTKAVRWLAHIGYTVHPAEPYGPFDVPFHKFEIRAK
jgi:hypothetical protein